jgi:hypothetical protein
VPRKATKTGRFLDLVTERHGVLASIPLHRVAGISADLAPQIGLNTGSARTGPAQGRPGSPERRTAMTSSTTGSPS